MKVSTYCDNAEQASRGAKLVGLYVKYGHTKEGRNRRRDCVVYSEEGTGKLGVVWGNETHIRVDVRTGQG